VAPSSDDQGLGDVSVDSGSGPGPEVRPDGRPPRVKANIQNNKFSGQKDQRNRIPVSTESPVQFEAATEAPDLQHDFAPTPVTPGVPGANAKKHSLLLMLRANKPECFSQASLSSLV